jgi:hypothetical protein
MGASYGESEVEYDSTYLASNGNTIYCAEGKNIRYEINPKRTSISFFIHDRLIGKQRIVDKTNLLPNSFVYETKSLKFHLTNIGSRLELDQVSDLIRIFCY